MFCLGKYVKYKEAVEVITSSNYLDNAKSNMLKLLYSTSKHSSLNTAIDRLTEAEFTDNQIKGILEKFNELDINPVTIPEDRYINEMPNPIDLIEEKKYYIWIHPGTTEACS